MSSQEDITLDGLPDPSAGFNKDVLFEPKPQPKIVRVLTVMAYVLSVSMAAIMLSIYYIFMWDGRPHIGALRGAGPEFDHHEFSVSQYNESVENISEHHYKSSSRPFHFARRNSSAKMEKFSAETVVEPREVTISSLGTVEKNFTDSSTHNYENTEMQQQFTDDDAEVLKILSTVATTAEHISPENTSWPSDYEGLEDFSGASPFMKKLMDNRYDEDY